MEQTKLTVRLEKILGRGFIDRQAGKSTVWNIILLRGNHKSGAIKLSERLFVKSIFIVSGASFRRLQRGLFVTFDNVLL